MAEKKPYICTRRIDHDGDIYEPTAEIELEEAHAGPLLAAGAIKIDRGEAPAPSQDETDQDLDEPEVDEPEVDEPEADEPEADEPDADETFRYHAEHRGAGRWYVIDETTGEAAEGTEAMKRAEAEELADKMNQAESED